MKLGYLILLFSILFIFGCGSKKEDLQTIIDISFSGEDIPDSLTVIINGKTQKVGVIVNEKLHYSLPETFSEIDITDRSQFYFRYNVLPGHYLSVNLNSTSEGKVLDSISGTVAKESAFYRDYYRLWPWILSDITPDDFLQQLENANLETENKINEAVNHDWFNSTYKEMIWIQHKVKVSSSAYQYISDLVRKNNSWPAEIEKFRPYLLEITNDEYTTVEAGYVKDLQNYKRRFHYKFEQIFEMYDQGKSYNPNDLRLAVLDRLYYLQDTAFSRNSIRLNLQSLLKDLHDKESVEPVYSWLKDKDIPEEILSGFEQKISLLYNETIGNWVCTDLTGKEISLNDFKGKYLYIDIWATWCGPCKVQIPHLKVLEEKLHHKKNLEFVSISTDSNIEVWQKYLETEEMTGTQLYSPGAWKSEVCKLYQITSIPRFILLDQEGNVINLSAPRPSDPKTLELLKDLR